MAAGNVPGRGYHQPDRQAMRQRDRERVRTGNDRIAAGEHQRERPDALDHELPRQLGSSRIPNPLHSLPQRSNVGRPGETQWRSYDCV